uniref:Uncharacterized protein n=1 Tax=Oryza glaberrima TaxID=4538 RepID=I1NZ51_ORYGL
SLIRNVTGSREHSPTIASAGALPAVGHLATARSTWHLSFPSFGFARLAEKKDQKAKTGLIDRNRSLHF